MDIHATLEEVARWCAKQTAARDPRAIEVECHATVWITIGEAAPPWHVRWQRRCSSGAGAPIAQLRYDLEMGDWALHHGGTAGGWCDDEDAIRAGEVAGLLDEIAADRAGRFQGLPPDFNWDYPY
jgi:hypothetical protein